ncbi:MAG: hypothetical protein MZU97_25510 [Bacillus subtilis]|nr:hypothetical protein [Bacillus subtilis]
MAAELKVFGTILSLRSYLTIQTTIPKDQLDATLLSLTPWGLSFQQVSLEELEAELLVLPEEGMGWISSLGMVFDWDQNLAYLLSRIQQSVDEDWLKSYQPD